MSLRPFEIFTVINGWWSIDTPTETRGAVVWFPKFSDNERRLRIFNLNPVPALMHISKEPSVPQISMLLTTRILESDPNDHGSVSMGDRLR